MGIFRKKHGRWAIPKQKGGLLRGTGKGKQENEDDEVAEELDSDAQPTVGHVAEEIY